MRNGRHVAGLVGLASLAALALAASAWAPATPGGVVSLSTDPDVEIDGQASSDFLGASVAGAGDVNGDGRPDVVVGAQLADNKGTSSGSAYVVFGSAWPTRTILQAGNLGAAGFRIDGASGDRAGSKVAGVGDVNGDGKADIGVAAPLADNNGRQNSGSVYIVFGRATTTAVDLSALGTGGYRIDGAAASRQFPSSLAAAGDVNGDGKPDVVASDKQAAYVIFGGDTTSLDTAAPLGSRGFKITSGGNVQAASGVGDLNGDGRADLGVAAAAGSNNTGSFSVVFGKASTADVDTAALGAGGFHLTLPDVFSGVSSSIGGGGDVNGDGRPDLVVSVPLDAANGRTDSGSVFVVFGGSSSDVDLSSLGARGFRIDGPNAESAVSLSNHLVATIVGDFDGDGKADVLLPMPGGDNGMAGTKGGSAYLVYGKSTTGTVDLASLGTAGFRMEGLDGATADAPGAVASAGDVNKDGRPDLLVGAGGATAAGTPPSTGRAYLILSRPPPDSEAPTLKMSPTKVKRKKVAKLKFDLHDNSGKATVEGGVYKGQMQMQRFVSDELTNGGWYVNWRAPAKPQKLSFCLVAKDAAGNQSKQACASIKVT